MSYFKTRSKEDRLSPQMGFKEGRNGSIDIQYFCPKGSAITYQDQEQKARILATRTASATALEQWEQGAKHYQRTRLSPQSLEYLNQHKPRGNGGKWGKYTAPRKTQTGAEFEQPLYYPLALHTGKTAALRGEILYLTEGEIKAHIACLHSVPTIGFAGVTNLVNSQKEEEYFTYLRQGTRALKSCFLQYLELYQPSKIVVLLDADALQKSTAKGRSFFANSLYLFGRAWFAESNPHSKKTALFFSVLGENAGGKGFDDALKVNPSLAEKALKPISEQRAEFHTVKADSYDYAEAAFLLVANNFQGFAKEEILKYSPKDRHISSIQIGAGAKYVGQVFNAQNSRNRLIIAQTGTGKTSLTYKLVAEGLPCIVVVPLQSQVEGYISKAAEKAVNTSNATVLAWYGKEKVKIETGAELLKLWEKGSRPSLLTTTYDSLPRLCEQLESFGFELSKYRLILDEIHNATTSTAQSYKHDAIYNALQIAHKFEAITALTGTYLPIAHKAIQALQIVEFLAPKRFISASVMRAETSIKDAAQTAISSLLCRGYKVIYLHNSKTAAAWAFYENVALPKQEKAWITASRKNTPAYRQLIDKQTLGNYKYIQVTSLVREGLDIRADKGDKIAYIVSSATNPQHPADVWQLANRHRECANLKDVQVLYIVGKSAKPNKYQAFAYAADFGREFEAESLFSASMQEQLAETKYQGSSDLHGQEKALSYFQATYTKQGISQPLQIAEAAYKLAARRAIANSENLAETLRLWGFDIAAKSLVSKAKSVQTEEAKQILKVAKEEAKKEIEELQFAAGVAKDFDTVCTIINKQRKEKEAAEFKSSFAGAAAVALQVQGATNIQKAQSEALEIIASAPSKAALRLSARRAKVGRELKKKNKAPQLAKLQALKRSLLTSSKKHYTAEELLQKYNAYAPRPVKHKHNALTRLRLLVEVDNVGCDKKPLYKVFAHGSKPTESQPAEQAN